MISKSDMDAYARALGNIADAAERAAARAVAAVASSEGLSVAEAREGAKAVLEPVATAYGEAASELAAEFYAMTTAADLPPAEVAPETVAESVDATVRYQVRKLMDGDVEGFARACGTFARDSARRSAAATMLRAAERDRSRGVRFARVPSGTETCAFCRMLASRGFVYWSRETAGALDHFHRGCDCRVVASDDPEGVEGYDPDREWTLWKRFEEIDADKSIGPAERAARKAALLGAGDDSLQVYSGVSDEHRRAIESLLEKSGDTDASRLYRRHVRDFRAPSFDYDQTAFYSPAAGTVTIDMDDAFNGKKEPGDTWFHEFGHNIDYIEGGGTPFSSLWRGGAFPKQLKDEARAAGLAVKNEMAARIAGIAENERMPHAVLHQLGLIDIDTYYDYRYGRIGRAELAESCKKPTLSHAYKMIGYEVSKLTDRRKHAVSDIFGGATGNRAVDGWGHEKGYWDKDGTCLATEAFAEMFSGCISSPESLEYIRKCFPRSFGMFQEMLKEMLANG